MAGLGGLNACLLSGRVGDGPIVVEDERLGHTVTFRLDVPAEPRGALMSVTVVALGHRAAWAMGLRRGSLVALQGMLMPWFGSTIAVHADWIVPVERGGRDGAGDARADPRL